MYPAVFGLLSLSAVFHLATGQQRLLLPEGTVITVKTAAPLSSASVREGEAFRTTVADSVRVEGFTVIPEGSTIDGVVTLVRRADERQSGVIGVEFNRLRLPKGSEVVIDGKLTSLDPSERRQIDAQTDAQVLFVGGRRGTGAAIGAVGASGGAGRDPLGNVLGALGTLLSKGADVTVPANTPLAVQLERGLTMGVMSTQPIRGSDAFTIYTSASAIRAGQQALRAKGYYRGATDGALNEATQRALVEFQIDSDIIATGNLDGRTAEALGLQLARGASTLTPAEATLLRRNAQILTTRYRNTIGIAEGGRLDQRRTYDPAEIELYFALSAFSDNASLYEEMRRLSGNVEGQTAAGSALAGAARRVDEALRTVRVSPRTEAIWGALQEDLARLDSTYARRQ
ncbi:MAG: peptidoglycan-binding protein [Gemmatimonadetes bacterium]|nr:peptidoglycan-binding protein [Gemmatimonadota bacterium]